LLAPFEQQYWLLAPFVQQYFPRPPFVQQSGNAESGAPLLHFGLGVMYSSFFVTVDEKSMKNMIH
jgi:hypothetical protein